MSISCHRVLINFLKFSKLADKGFDLFTSLRKRFLNEIEIFNRRSTIFTEMRTTGNLFLGP